MTYKNCRFYGGPLHGRLESLEVEGEHFMRAFVECLIERDGKVYSQVCLYTPVNESADCIIAYLHDIQTAWVDGKKH